MIDIDNFKRVNDIYGHGIGDEVIKIVVNIITTAIRDSDLSIRFGGEEFLVLFPNTNEDGAFNISEHIRDTVEKTHINLSKSKLGFTVSIGVIQIDLQEELDFSINTVDKALYIAKNNGRNMVYKDKTV